MTDSYNIESLTALALSRATVDALMKKLEAGDLSDGAHTHNELYEHRMWLTIHALQAWSWWSGFEAVKSRKHSDGELCFGGGWFILMVKLPAGWISYHYEDQYWDLFHVPEAELPPEYDGHTPADVVDRMRLSAGQVSLASVGQRLAREEFAKMEARIIELEKDSAILHALYAGGVDNWEGYELSLEEMDNEDLRIRLVLATVRSQPRRPGPPVHRLPHPAAELVASPDVSC